jgi:hypothetical protein
MGSFITLHHEDDTTFASDFEARVISAMDPFASRLQVGFFLPPIRLAWPFLVCLLVALEWRWVTVTINTMYCY